MANGGPREVGGKVKELTKHCWSTFTTSLFAEMDGSSFLRVSDKEREERSQKLKEAKGELVNKLFYAGVNSAADLLEGTPGTSGTTAHPERKRKKS